MGAHKLLRDREEHVAELALITLAPLSLVVEGVHVLLVIEEGLKRRVLEEVAKDV